MPPLRQMTDCGFEFKINGFLGKVDGTASEGTKYDLVKRGWWLR